MSGDLSVIAPCLNEELNVDVLVARLQATFTKHSIRGEIVLVDDGSTDRTGAVIDEAARVHDNVVAVHHPVNRGMAEGWTSGLQASTCEYVCIIDADLQYLPEDVARLYREIRFSHADMVQGVRSSIGRLRDARFTLSRGLNALLNVIFGMRSLDNKSGFVVCRREVLEDILRHRHRFYYFQTFIAVAAHAKGYRIREIETLFESRLAGTSFLGGFPWKVVLRTLYDLAAGLVEFRSAFKADAVLEDFLRHIEPDPRVEPLKGWRRALWRIFMLTFPLHTWMISRRVEACYKELQQSQWLTPEKLRELQEIKLRRLIHHAFHHVPYYREQARARGLSARDFRTLDDLQNFPLLSKQDVRDNFFDLVSDNHRKDRVQRIATSGSTGEPFVVFVDQHQLEYRWAATLRGTEWTGYRFGDPQLRLWHQTIGMTWRQVLLERIDALLSRRSFFPVFDMDERTIGRFVDRLTSLNPTLIDGYAEALNLIAGYMVRHGVTEVSPTGVLCSAQALTPESRRIIESAFGCPVFDKYGSREFSGIAYECDAHTGQHVVAESYVVEVLTEGRPAKPGEVGEVVITDLHNFCMPLIRYRLGDLARLVDEGTPCPCGRSLPRLASIEGRVQSIVVGANGRLAPGSLFLHVLKDFEHMVRRYKVVQDEGGAVEILVVKAPRFDATAFDREVLGIFRQILGEATPMTVRFVDDIPLGRTGKHQPVVSRIVHDFQRVSLDG